VAKKVAILHYSYPPTIGGVEFIMQGHAEIMAKNGIKVKIISGTGESNNKNIRVQIIPGLLSLAESNDPLNKEINNGIVSDNFYKWKDFLKSEIKNSLSGANICIIHNVMSMHFNLPLTAALDELIDELHINIKFYIWYHDGVAINPDYSLPKPDQYPWNLMKKYNPNAYYIAISMLRKKQMSELYGISGDLINIVSDGADVKSFLRISDRIWDIFWENKFFDNDLIMLFPSRILKRKNYELGIKIVRELLNLGKTCVFLITGPSDPHNPQTVKYYNYLHKLSGKLNVRKNVVFLHDFKKKYGDDFGIGYFELQNLYCLSDLILLTSKQEGFGIPLLEAGAYRLPIVCTNIAPLPEVVGKDALLFNLKDNPKKIAERIIKYIEKFPTYHMLRKVITRYSWEAIYKDYLSKIII